MVDAIFGADARDPEVLALHQAVLEGLGKALADVRLVVVCGRAICMTKQSAVFDVDIRLTSNRMDYRRPQ